MQTERRIKLACYAEVQPIVRNFNCKIMNTFLIYGIIFVILLALELAYFKVADKFNIIDKPNEKSSHSAIVLRGGGIIFLLGAWVWAPMILSIGFSLGESVTASGCRADGLWFAIRSSSSP